MFKFLVILLLCIIAVHSCAANTALYAVHLPFNHDYIALVNGADVHTVNIPFQLTDSYWRIW